MIERDDEIVEILELDTRTGVTKDGEVVALDYSELSTEAEQEHPEADEETTQTDNQQDAYTPGPLEAIVDNYKDQTGPHRQVSDQETTQINNQRPVYIPGPLENQVDNYKDRVGSHRYVSDLDACIASGIIYEDFLAERKASIKAMRDLDKFASDSIIKAHKTK